MPRVKRGVQARARHKKILKEAGFVLNNTGELTIDFVKKLIE